ncbi:MAG: ABC-F family ATP-binding cassette domain-containing protein [Ignavibacteriales bacterium]|nr:ABC-F family ATP-binding cassette domain-containing protein [Ignavibacteriales bacterium]
MIDIKNLSIQFTGLNLFEDVNLRISKHDKIALVGSNGTGKSTLLKLLYGIERPETGEIFRQKGIRIGYLQQDLISSKGQTLFAEVKSSLPDLKSLDEREKEILEGLNTPTLLDEDREELVEELGEIHHKKDEIDFYSADSKIEKVLAGLGFKNKDFARSTAEFSGGWQMRIQLAQILLAENDLILLDEPTNHLDLDTLTWLEEFLQNFKGSLVIVSHDRHFVDSVTNKTLEVFDKQIGFFPGNYSSYLKFKDERDIQLRAQQKTQEKKIKETEKFIERFRYKSTKSKQVQSRIKQLEKLDSISIAEEEKRIELRFPEPPRSGVVPVELKNVSKSYAELDVLKNVDLLIERGDKIAIVGPNGAGKTTLAKIIGGKLEPSSGEINYGHNTMVSYYEQEVADALNPEDDLIDTLEEMNNDLSVGHIRSILGSFLFSGDDVFKKVKVLSGGEKSRVALARLLLTQSNLIILDEPTNHLDFSSKEILKRALVEFSGTLIIVSHDIDFLESITTKVLEIRDQHVKVNVGGIDYYLQKKKEEEQIEINNKTSEQKNTRKDQKRQEAEIRQQKFVLTKDLKTELKRCEKEIQKLEELKIKLESELIDPNIFSNPQLAKEKNLSYEKTKSGLEIQYNHWTEVTDQLEQIDKQFGL